MKILLLGATGRTGKLVLNQAVAKGHEVHCLSRHPERILKQMGVTLFEGDPAVKADLERAMTGCNAVISVLNVSRISDFPWSKLRTPKNYLSSVMKVLLPLAKSNGINRVVVCSAWGVAETKNDLPKWFKWFIDNSNIGFAYKDHERQEEIITKTNLNWCIVRPVGLTNSKKEETIKEIQVNESKPGLIISRQSVATYLVDALGRKDLVKKKVVIFKA